jgi:hypothetical protein
MDVADSHLSIYTFSCLLILIILEILEFPNFNLKKIKRLSCDAFSQRRATNITKADKKN